MQYLKGMRYYELSRKQTARSPSTSMNSVLPPADTPASRARPRPIRGSLNSRSILTCRHSEALAYDRPSPQTTSGGRLSPRGPLGIAGVFVTLDHVRH